MMYASAPRLRDFTALSKLGNPVMIILIICGFSLCSFVISSVPSMSGSFMSSIDKLKKIFSDFSIASLPVAAVSTGIRLTLKSL